MAISSVILYTPASSALSRPTMTFLSVGKSIPQSALSRSPGGSFDAHPEPATVSVSRNCFIPVRPVIFSMFSSLHNFLNHFVGNGSGVQGMGFSGHRQ